MAGNDFLQTYLKTLTTEQLLELISLAASQCEDAIDKELTNLCNDCVHKISAADLDAFEQDAYQRGRADAIEDLQRTWVEGFEAGKQSMTNLSFNTLHDFIEDTTETYGCSCFEGRSEALDNFETWLYEQYKGQNNE